MVPTTRYQPTLIPPCRVPIDIRTLPSLVPPDVHNITARAVVPVIEDNIAKLKTLLASNELASETDPTPPDSTCQFAVYAQVHPSDVSAADMRELEDELMHPTGVTTVRRPPFQLDLAVVSPECGVLIEIKEADGMRSRVFFRKVTSCTSGRHFPLYPLICRRRWIRWAHLPCNALAALAPDVREQNSRCSLENFSLVVHRTGVSGLNSVCWCRLIHIIRLGVSSFYRSTSLSPSLPRVGLQWRWSPRHFSHVLSSHTKWYAKRRCTISGTANRLINMQQFVLLIQQIQAPEDLATLPSVPSPQAPSTQSPSPPASINNASPTGVPTNEQNTTAVSPTTPPNFSVQPPSRQETPLFSVVRFIFRAIWYDEYNRICAPPSFPIALV